MSDLALGWQTDMADLRIERGDLALDGGLESAIAISLFSDRRADDGDVLPAAEADRRGWWGDAVPAVEGDRIGSRLWLLAREKQTEPTLRRVEQCAAEALQWLVEDRVAERVEVAASVPRRGLLGLLVTIHRPKADPVEYRFTQTWAAQERRG